MLRRLLTLLLMLSLATGAAADCCPPAAGAASEASAHAGMLDCPHALAEATAAASSDFSDPSGFDDCEHCQHCRVPVPPIEFSRVAGVTSPARVLWVQAQALDTRVPSPLLRPPIS